MVVTCYNYIRCEASPIMRACSEQCFLGAYLIRKFLMLYILL
jgi:hypothetical protein